jgi:hypothetical protein
MKVSQLPEVQLVVQLGPTRVQLLYIFLLYFRKSDTTYCTRTRTVQYNYVVHGDRDEFLVLGGITEVYVYSCTRVHVHVQFLFFFNPKNTNHLRRYQIRF